MQRKAIFFDRDGIVNRRIVDGYVTDPSEFEPLDQFPALLSAVRADGRLAILITNQRGIGRGLMTPEDLNLVHEAMERTLKSRSGSTFDAIYYCPHDRHEQCPCRKPEPGLLLRAAEDFGVNLPQSWMIGDSETDVTAGTRAGCRTVRVAPSETQTAADIHVEYLSEVWPQIQKYEQREPR